MADCLKELFKMSSYGRWNGLLLSSCKVEIFQDKLNSLSRQYAVLPENREKAFATEEIEFG